MLAAQAFGQSCPRGKGSSCGNPQTSRPADYYRGATPPPASLVLTPHGGQYLKTESNFFELVILPLQMRVYLFDKTAKPISARDLQAQISLQLPGERTPRKIPFTYVTIPPEITGQDYAVAAFDMASLDGKDTPARIEFSGLPDQKGSTASFSPMLARSAIRPYVAQVLATPAEKDAVLQQHTCPVSRDVLGAKRPVIKILIDDYPLYLCGEECIDAVRETPEKYLPMAQASRRL
jgi:hypothetical protein